MDELTEDQLPLFVLALPRVQVERLDYEDPHGTADRDDLALVPLPLARAVPAWLRQLEVRGLLRSGVMLLQNPMYRRLYVPVDEADILLAQSKGAVFAELCQHLGARQVTVKLIADQRGEATWSVTADASLRRGGGQAELRRAKIEKLRSSWNADDRFTGGPPDLPAARALLETTGLDGDTAMTGLVRSRELSGNPHQRRELTLSLSSQVRRTLEVAASIKVPPFVKLGVDVEHEVSTVAEFTATYIVEF